MKKIFLTGLIGLAISTSGWSAWVHDWSHSSGSTSGDRGKCISNPVNNFIASAGWFNGTVDFDPGAGTFNLTAAAGASDMYLMSYNTSGVFQWARLITGTGTEDPMNILTNPTTGDIYVCGRYSGAADFDPGPGTTPSMTTTGPAEYDAFLACYGPTGTLTWCFDLGNPAGTGADGAYGLCFDHLGNLLLCGEFSGTVNFDPLGVVTNVTSSGGTDAFLARYTTAAGTLIGAYAYRMGGTTDDCARGVVADANGICVTGWFTGGAADMNPFAGGGVGVLASAGGKDIFTLKFSGATFVWAARAGGVSDDMGLDIAQDGIQVFITGSVGVDAVGATFPPLSMIVTGVGTDGFIAAYDASTVIPTGVINWLTPFSGPEDDAGQNIATDKAGYVYVTGYFASSTLTINSTTMFFGAVANSGAAGSYDWYMTRHTTSGVYKDASAFGSAFGEDCPGLYAWKNPATAAHEVFVTGSFSQTVDFDPGAGIVNHTAAGIVARDLFIARYSWTTPPRLAAPEANTTFSTYPNPTTGTLHITGLPGGSIVEMYSLDGKKAGSWVVENTDGLTLGLGDLENGIYLVRVTEPDGTVRSEKIVVQH